MHSPNGSIVLSHDDIIKEFMKYYSDLYNKPPSYDTVQIDNFLEGCGSPKVSQTDRTQFDLPVTVEEIISVIKSLNLKKSPGPDGIPAEFYKEFSTHFSSHLIIVLPKLDKDPSLVTNYCPISLINQDCNLYAKIIATRLAFILPYIIHVDQSGFMKTRNSTNNTRLLFHAIDAGSLLPFPAVVLALNAEKAFDKMYWQYLFRTLSSFN